MLQAAGHSPYHPTSPSWSVFGFGQNTYTLQATQSNCVWLWQDSSGCCSPSASSSSPGVLVFQLGCLCSQHCWETEKPPGYCVYVPSWRSCTTWATSVGFRYLLVLPLLSISKEKKNNHKGNATCNATFIIITASLPGRVIWQRCIFLISFESLIYCVQLWWMEVRSGADKVDAKVWIMAANFLYLIPYWHLKRWGCSDTLWFTGFWSAVVVKHL